MNEDAPRYIFPMDDGTITIGRLAGDALADWRLDRCMARHYAAENEQLRAEVRYRRVIEKYNRAHGQNPKITLKDICKQEGESYEAVRKFRLRNRKRKTKK